MGLASELTLLANLAAKHLADEMAGLSDFRQGQGTIDISSVASCRDHPRSFQDRQVLRKVGPRDPEFFLQP